MDVYIKRFAELSSHELYDILQLRVAVFVVEQNCPYQELDGKDSAALHVFLKKDKQIQAYLRVVEANAESAEMRIGRVISVKRGVGLGAQVMREGIRVAKESMGAKKISVEAQSYAQKFYERFGFVRVSDEFFEDGIAHVSMLLTL